MYVCTLSLLASRWGGGGGVYGTLFTVYLLSTAHQRGRAGGGWEEGQRTLSQPLQTGYRHVHSPVSNKSQNNGAVEVGSVEVGGVSSQDDEASYTEQERRLVEEITTPGGVRAAPPRERLNAFVNRSVSLVCLLSS